MLLSVLKTKLETTTGTAIGQVLFNWKEYQNELREKIYPVVLWSLNGAKFKKEGRTNVIQKTKELTLTCFVIGSYNSDTQTEIEVWDTLESQLDTYLNAVNAMSNLQVVGIEEIEGEYYPEGLTSADRELAVAYKITLKMFC